MKTALEPWTALVLPCSREKRWRCWAPTAPEILVLDEPNTFLDPPGLRNLLHLLKELPQAKLIITHNTHFALAVATRAVFFEKGKLVADGGVVEIMERFDWSYAPLPADDLRYSAPRRF